jgi:RND family efflux transporter MFP subunit
MLALTVLLTGWTVHRLVDKSSSPEHAASVTAVQADSAQLSIGARLVSVTRPVPLQLQPTIILEGSIVPQQSTSLGFSVPGTLDRLSVRVGDDVKAGARLARLEESAAAAHFAMTAARVRAAKAQLTLAADHAERNTELAARGSLQAAGAIDSQLQSTVMEAELDVARALQEQARIALNEHTLRAPFSGTVIAAPDAVGAVVTPGVPIFRLARLESLKLNASVSEAEARLLSVGAKVHIDTAAGIVEGSITKLLDTLEENTRRVPVEAEFPAPGALRAGAFVHARAEAHGPIQALRVPANVLRPGTSNEVFIVVPGYHATLALRRTEHEPESSGNLLVHTGLCAEDVVVVAPEPDARAGDVVLVRDSSSLAQETR